jgi:hypothetical protein
LRQYDSVGLDALNASQTNHIFDLPQLAELFLIHRGTAKFRWPDIRV